jgi:hypothetical protein
MNNEKVFITQDELATIQGMNTEFSKAKMALGDMELQKYGLLKHIENLKKDFADHEQLLINKYGKDSVINLQTGEVSQKTIEDGAK